MEQKNGSMFSLDDTIAAIATPVGIGAIGIVRISGNDALAIADEVFLSKNKVSLCPSHRILYGHIIHPDTREIIDEVLVAVMRKPHSYTREDVVEISTHGGIGVANLVLQAVLKAGAREANPGEFTLRAFLNGRIDLSQAEAILDIINSRTEEGIGIALSQLEGKLSGEIKKLREGLINIVSLLELSLDFVEEDLVLPPEDEIKRIISSTIKQLNRLISTYKRGNIIRNGINALIVGKPNVGKSSIFNALLLEDRAIVTPYPGTTRDMVEGWLNLDGIPVRLIDSAGISDTVHPVESIGVQRTRNMLGKTDVIIAVFDVSQGLTQGDKALINEIQNKNVVYTLNKKDLGVKFPHKDMLNGKKVVYTSALKMDGIDNLAEAIKGVVSSEIKEKGEVIITNERHYIALKGAVDAMKRAKKNLKLGYTQEIIAEDIRESIEHLEEIIGENISGDVLNNIFSKFCIGK